MPHREPVAPGHERVAQVGIDEVEPVVPVAAQLVQRLVQPPGALRLQRLQHQEPAAAAPGIHHRIAPVGDADEQTVLVHAQPAPLRQIVARREHAVLDSRSARRPREHLVAVSRDREQLTRPLQQDQRAHGLLFIV